MTAPNSYPEVCCTVLIKICGNTRAADAKRAYERGADLLGLIFAESPRRVSEERAREIVEAVSAPERFVGVFVNESLEVIRRLVKTLGLQWVQLHGEEPPETSSALRASGTRVIKACRVRSALDIEKLVSYPADYLLFDSYRPHVRGGTGQAFNWDILKQFNALPPFFLSGGITIDNVEEAVEKTHPSGIDISSSLESRPGEKDPEKIDRFLEKVRGLPHV